MENHPGNGKNCVRGARRVIHESEGDGKATRCVGLSIATLLAQHHKVYAVDIVPEKLMENELYAA